MNVPPFSEGHPGLRPHPIQDAAPRPLRALPMGLSVLLAGGFLAALSAFHWGEGWRTWRDPGLIRYRTIAVDLTDPRPLPSPALQVAAPAPREGRGEGHPLGTGTIDPSLLSQTPGFHALPDPEAPPVKDLLAGPQLPAGLNLQLPLAEGGNGMAKGRGGEARAGLGSGPGGHRPDFRLVVLHSETFTHRLKPGENLANQVVRVRIAIGPDGVPLRAEAVGGPPLLFAEAVQTALRYRFEPLAPHGLRAPYELHINFKAVLLP